MMDERSRSSSPIDIDYARQRFGEAAGDVIPLVAAALLEEGPQRIAEVEQSLEIDDATGVLRGAHALKGAVKIFAAGEVIDTTEKIEALARAGNLDPVPDLMPVLKEQCGRMLKALREAFDV